MKEEQSLAPYRGAGDMVFPARPWRSRLAGLIAYFLPESLGRNYGWYRVSRGGQWTFYWERRTTNAKWMPCGWYPVPLCPWPTGSPGLNYAGVGQVSACEIQGQCVCEKYG